jgi:hypothetical protein
MSETSTERDVREVAAKRLQKRRGFAGHLLVYVLVNSALVVIWLMIGRNDFFWPVFPMVIWGVGVVMNAWDVYFVQEITDEDIDREIARMRACVLRRSGSVPRPADPATTWARAST